MTDDIPAEWLTPPDLALEKHNLVASWDRLQQALAAVPADRLDQPGAVGDWSIRLLMSHIAFWDRYALNRAANALAGNLPRGADADTLNAPLAEEHAGESVDTARADMEAAHAELLAFIATIPDDHPLLGNVLRDMSPDTWRHYDEHIDAVLAMASAATDSTGPHR